VLAFGPIVAALSFPASKFAKIPLPHSQINIWTIHAHETSEFKRAASPATAGRDFGPIFWNRKLAI
jgi:hypothetical protein